jgi:hypothetical protein
MFSIVLQAQWTGEVHKPLALGAMGVTRAAIRRFPASARGKEEGSPR